MNLIEISREIDNYINNDVSRFLGYSEVYDIEIEQINNKYYIYITSRDGYSLISAMSLSEDPVDQTNINEFERNMNEFVMRKFPNVNAKTIGIDYDYDSIIIRFELK